MQDNRGFQGQCTEDEHDDEDDFQTSEFELKGQPAGLSITNGLHTWSKLLIESLQLFCEIG